MNVPFAACLFLFALFVYKPASGQVQSRTIGQWVINTETDRKGRLVSTMALKQAREGQRFFGIQCAKKETSIFVTFDAFVGSSPRIEYRMGEQAPLTKTWNSASDGKSAFYPGKEIEFITLLSPHPTFTARVVPRGAGPLIIEFDLEGLAEALVPVREACNW